MRKKQALMLLSIFFVFFAWACIYENSSGQTVQGIFQSQTTASVNSVDYPELTGDEYTDVLAVINYYRTLSHLSPVVYDEALTQGCYDHINYLIRNQIFSHEEKPYLPGYTEKGALAGSESLLAQYSESMVQAVELWMNSLYHRLPLLEPGLERVGWYFEDGYAALNVTAAWDRNVDNYDPVLFPAPQQTGFHPVFDWKEIPSPLPEEIKQVTGNFITIMFNPYEKLDFSDDSIKIYDEQGQEIKLLIKQPNNENDPNSVYQRNTLVAIPLHRLEENSMYTIEVDGQVNSNHFYEIWSFRTGTL